MDEDVEPSRQAFQALDKLLNDTPDVLEIEILPSALCPPGQPSIVRDGRCVGISKKSIALAYKHAITGLLSLSDSAPDVPVIPYKAVRASTVVLLLSPEHLAAANTRKRYILSLPNPSTALQEVLAAELRLLDTFLTSPLPRHTKSPTLWSHRRWLLTCFALQLYYPAAQGLNGLNFSMVLDLELHVVQRAAIHHPRNYYAFDYLRMLLVRTLPTHPIEEAQGVADPTSITVHLARQALSVVRLFCHTHPSDTSAWSALLFLLRIADDESNSLKIVKETLELARSLRWRGEAVWTFIRTAIAGGIAWRVDSRRDLLDMLQSLVRDLKQDTHDAHHGQEGKAAAGDVVDVAQRDSALMLEAAKGALIWIQPRIPKPP